MTPELDSPLATGVTAELYKAAIGPRGQDYYLRHFLKFDAGGKTGISWHWPACCATLSWLVYRKMWRWALAYAALLLGLALLVFGVGKLAFDYSESSGLLLLLLFLGAAFVLPGLYANAWYYTFCSENISAALRKAATLREACEALAGQAGTRKRWFGLVAANLALLALVISGATLVLNLGRGTADLARMKTGRATASGDLQITAPPAAVAISEVVSEPVSAPVSPTASAAAVAAAGADTPAEIEAVVPEAVASKASGAVAGHVLQPVVVETDAALPVPPAVKPDAGSHPRSARSNSDVKPGAAAASRPWFVQVGAFAQESNAHNVRARVTATGLPVSADLPDAPGTPAGRLIRVRVGPFASKSEAEKAALQIKALDLPTVLVR